MASNFTFLLERKEYKDIAKAAVEAEKCLGRSPACSVVLAERALKLALRWMFTHDAGLALPYRESPTRLMHEPTLKRMRPDGLDAVVYYIFGLGNVTAYRGLPVSRETAVLALKGLACSLQWMVRCYDADFSPKPFDEEVLPASEKVKELDRIKLLEIYKQPFEGGALLPQRKKNREIAEEMAARREANKNGRPFTVPANLVAECRGRYMMVDGAQAGWTLDKDCFMNIDVEVIGGHPLTIDILFTDEQKKPLAVMAVKAAAGDMKEGVKQAKVWADVLEKKHGERPFIFLLHEGEYWFCDERRDNLRRIYGCFSREGLERRMEFRRLRNPEAHADISGDVTSRPYQTEAVWRACEAVHEGARRVLISTPPGTGKTRMAAGIVEALNDQHTIGTVLYLADREELTKQAYGKFRILLPDMKMVDILEDARCEAEAKIVFATGSTMMDAINEHRSESGARLYNPAHFDLIVIDESHPSVYEDHASLLRYFDAILLGFSSLPPEAPGEAEIYRFYELEPGKPTYAYRFEEALRDGWLVDFEAVDAAPEEIMDPSLRYAELTPEQKDIAEMEYSDTGTIANKDFDKVAVNNWLFSEEKIQAMLENLLTCGRKAKDGNLGKTIIFAKNSLQAKAIAFIFQRLHPEFGPDFIKAFDVRTPNLAEAVNDFTTEDGKPTIAVSVDVLDTGFDIPSVVNIVFFRKVHSLSKFSQMLGRGMRFCPDLGGEGKDKEDFLVIDYCKNFLFFGMEDKVKR